MDTSDSVNEVVKNDSDEALRKILSMRRPFGEDDIGPLSNRIEKKGIQEESFYNIILHSQFS